MVGKCLEWKWKFTSYFPQTPITFIPLSIFYCNRVCSCPPPQRFLKNFNALKVTIRIDSISYFSLNIQYDWLINILILWYEEPGGVTIEIVHGRALYVWINKMVSLYIITTPWPSLVLKKKTIDYEWDAEMKSLQDCTLFVPLH